MNNLDVEKAIPQNFLDDLVADSPFANAGGSDSVPGGCGKITYRSQAQSPCTTEAQAARAQESQLLSPLAAAPEA